MKWAKSCKGQVMGSNAGRWGDWALRFWAKLVKLVGSYFCGCAELVHGLSQGFLKLIVSFEYKLPQELFGAVFFFWTHLRDAEQGVNDPYIEEILSLRLWLSGMSVQQMRVAVEGMHGNTVSLENLTTAVCSVRERVIYTLPPNCREQMQVKRQTTYDVFEGLKRFQLIWPEFVSAGATQIWAVKTGFVRDFIRQGKCKKWILANYLSQVYKT